MSFISLRKRKQVTWFIGISYCLIIYDYCSMCLYLAEYRKAGCTCYCVMLYDHCSMCFFYLVKGNLGAWFIGTIVLCLLSY